MESLWPAIFGWNSLDKAKGEHCLEMYMATYPPLWYGLLFIVSICGVATWYLRNFTTKEELTKLVAFSGIIAMISLLGWTLTEF